MLKTRRIPIIAGLLILLAGLGAGVFLVQRSQTFFLRADPTTAPRQVKITNLTDTGYTVSWITSKEAVGLIRYGETSRLVSSIADDRDQLLGKTSLSLTHHVTVKNLKPKTTYYFKIVSGSGVYDENGQPYRVTTGPKVSLPEPASDLAYSKVLKQNGQPAEGAIVYLSLANTQPQSALVQESGNWVIPLNLARAANLITYAAYDKEASVEEIYIQAAQAGTATAVTTTKNDSPLPTITLGQTFDFRQEAEEIEQSEPEETTTQEATEEAEGVSSPASKFSVETQATPTATTKELTIINPEIEEGVSTQRPAILGTGPPGQTIEVTIESPTTYSGTVLVDDQGNWEWNPPVDLEPGEHTLTATFTDGSGKKQTITHTFTVFAAGEGDTPAIEATPSAEASPTATPTPTTAPRTAVPSTEGGVPDSGYLTPTFLVFIMGVGLILTGFVINKFAAHG